ncbi:unnamed protein product [Spirodela intermedia]|uniref:Peptidase C14 caspase domain-containing protein n=1 Tax=Spirodela intermedia TaxID=51605 RepID=A0A7I8J4S7_SPIIN|nr:unnamed protein product [Spirodela intermedia]CAA6664390.1 unnamed protein product [Spirodela intermedia]
MDEGAPPAGPPAVRHLRRCGGGARLPSGARRQEALLVGVAYRSTRYELRGSITDVNSMKFLLQTKFGFPAQSILVLSEDEGDRSRIPTRENMVAAMRWLVHGCRPGDSLVFHFSGHGSQKFDTSMDEVDGYDETLCPLDYEISGMISDDEVNEMIVRPLPRGVKLHAVVDACHSGSSLDLPYVCKANRNGDYHWEVRTHVKKATSGGLAICFSGCDDHQTSSDTSVFTQDIVTGAMTYCFIQAVENGPGVTYGHILLGCVQPFVNLIEISASVVPQLSSSEQFNIFQTPFIL